MSKDKSQVLSSRLKPCKSQNTKDLQGFSVQNGTESGQIFSLQNNLYDAIQDVCKEKKIMLILPKTYIDYYPPKLHKGKDWYIAYYVKNPSTGKMQRFKVKVNRFRTEKEKSRAAKEIIAALSERLALGWSPFLSAEQPKATVAAFDALDAFSRIKSKEMENQSLATYRSYIRVFKNWLVSQGFTEHTLICVIDKAVSIAYMDYLDERDDVSPRTFNNYLSFMVTLFDWMMEKGYVQQNFFLGIRRKPKKLIQKSRRMLTNNELAELFHWLAEEDIAYLAICLLCYCCLMRPKEIALLKCGDIDLKNQLVHVRPEIAKNDNESFRTIPDVTLPVFRALDLSRPGWYLFGGHTRNIWDFTPSDRPMNKKKISDFWNKQVRARCGFGDDVQFYSLKDTGVTNMLGANVPITFVSHQADHSSIAITAIYAGKSPNANTVLKAVNILPD